MCCTLASNIYIKMKYSKKPFKVISLDRLTKKGVVVVSLKDLIRQVKSLFNKENGRNLKIVLEEDGTEIVNDEFLFSLDDFTKLMVLDSSNTWMASLPEQAVPKVVCKDCKEIDLGLSSIPKSEDGHESCFHPTKAILALAVNRCSHVMIWKAEDPCIPFSNWNKEEKLFISTSRKVITDLEWNVNGTQLAACSDDGDLLVWQYPCCNILLKIQKSTTFNYLQWNPSRKNDFLTGINDANGNEEICFWNSSPSVSSKNSTSNLVCKISPKQTDISDVQWIKENEVFINLNDYGLIEIREIEENKKYDVTQRVVKQLNCGKTWEMKYNHCTEYFAVLNNEKRILNIWSMDNEEPVYKLQVESDVFHFNWLSSEDMSTGVASARESLRKMTLICLFEDKLILWNPIEKDQKKQKRVIAEIPNLDSFSLSPNGAEYLALATSNDEIMLWSTKTWSLVFKSEPVDYIAAREASFSWLFGERATESYLKLVVSNGYEIRLFEGFL